MSDGLEFRCNRAEALRLELAPGSPGSSGWLAYIRYVQSVGPSMIVSRQVHRHDESGSECSPARRPSLTYFAGSRGALWQRQHAHYPQRMVLAANRGILVIPEFPGQRARTCRDAC